MRPSNTTSYFIDKATTVHGGRYDYSEATYVSASSKLTVICREHGNFEIRPQHHYIGGGCPTCGAVSRVVAVTSNTRAFVQKAVKVHGSLFLYNKTSYSHSHAKVSITCRTHGDFTITASSHLNGRGCQLCGAARRAKSLTKTTKEFIQQAKEVHGDKYLYDKTSYVLSSAKVTLTCRIHGDFLVKPSDHTFAGAGCATCANAQRSFLNPKSVSKLSREDQASGYTLYFIRLPGLANDLFKIGVTREASKRFQNIQRASKSPVEVIHTFNGNLRGCVGAEYKLHKHFKHKRYQGSPFPGHTECFHLDEDDLDFLGLLFSELELDLNEKGEYK